MIELEVYAAGVRDLNEILGPDNQLEAAPGLRYKIDRIFSKPGLEPGSEMQLLSV
jgi:hypothetical protein